MKKMTKKTTKKAGKKTSKKASPKTSKRQTKANQCCVLWGPCEKKVSKTTGGKKSFADKARDPSSRVFKRRDSWLKETIEEGSSLVEAVELWEPEREGMTVQETIKLHKHLERFEGTGRHAGRRAGHAAKDTVRGWWGKITGRK